MRIHSLWMCRLRIEVKVSPVALVDMSQIIGYEERKVLRSIFETESMYA